MDSCRACHRLKASRSVDQFRLEIETRLGRPMTFAGEATPTTPATDISSVRSLAAVTGLVRLPGEVLAELRSAVSALHSAGYVSTTLGSLAADAIAERIACWQAGQLGPDQLGLQLPTLFEGAVRSALAPDSTAGGVMPVAGRWHQLTEPIQLRSAWQGRP